MNKDLEKIRKIIREMIKNELDEISNSSGAGPYLTPNAFAKAPKKTTEVLGMKEVGESKKDELKEDDLLPFITRHLQPITEDIEPGIHPEELTPRQKIYKLTREARNNVNQIELLLDKVLKIKKEENVNSDDYYKRTHKALAQMNEKIKHCILKMNSMK